MSSGESTRAPRLSDTEMMVLAWGILDLQPKTSDAYKLAKEVLLRFGKDVP